jgi:hypothetical protein
MKLNALIAGVAFAVIGSNAQAETIERTFDIVASDFILASGLSTPAPVDPVELNFTLIFDPSAVIAPTTSGLTINAFTLPYPSIFARDGAGNLALGQILTAPLTAGLAVAIRTVCSRQARRARIRRRLSIS